MIGEFLFLSLLVPFYISATDFPWPAALGPAAGCWVEAYTEISTGQGYVHNEALALLLIASRYGQQKTDRTHLLCQAV